MLAAGLGVMFLEGQSSEEPNLVRSPLIPPGITLGGEEVAGLDQCLASSSSRVTGC